MDYSKTEREEFERKYKEVIPTLPKSTQNAKLTLPDGKEILLPIISGNIGPDVIDIRSLYQQCGYFTFDPGFFSTASCVSKIAYIDGEKGELLYRGFPIQELAEKSSYVETCYLLLFGVLPSKTELKKFEETMVQEMLIHEKLIEFFKGFQKGAHPMAILTGVFGALSAFMHEGLDIYNPKDRELAAIRIVAKLPTIAAIAFRTANGLPIVYPQKKYGFIENFLYMMFSNPSSEWQIAPEIIRAIDMICLLHADHEQNASTSTVRIAGSSLANPFAVIASGITCLWGPAHGGANEACINMLEEIGSVENVPQCIAMAKDKNKPFRIMGFGHRVYKNFDPRAKIMQKVCHDVVKAIGKKEPLLDIAMTLEAAALRDDYFISKKLYPNVDFYTGIIYKSMGIPKNMFTVIFAMARSVGWISQWLEMMSEVGVKIGRPRQLYVGYKEREFVPIEKREKEEETRVPEVSGIGDVLAAIKLH
jgi:citrate synthase